MSECHAGSDGDCTWKDCPQVRDSEPYKSGRHCPLDAAPAEQAGPQGVFAPVELATVNVLLLRARLEEAARWHSAHLLQDKGPLAFGCDLFQERDDCRYVVALRNKLEAALRGHSPVPTKEVPATKVLRDALNEIEVEHCLCGAGREHRSRYNWEYCGIHERVDNVWKYFVDTQDAAAPTKQAGEMPESFAKLLELQIRIQYRFEQREPSAGAWSEPFRIISEVFKEVLPLKDEASQAPPADSVASLGAEERLRETRRVDREQRFLEDIMGHLHVESGAPSDECLWAARKLVELRLEDIRRALAAAASSAARKEGKK